MMTLGVLGSSQKENEKRVPIHPLHLIRVDAASRAGLYFEKGYGEPFRVSDGELARQCAGLMTAAEIHARCDIVLNAKPVEEDFEHWREGSVLWGWPHLVQGEAITQVSIDKRLTWIAWESMCLWPARDVRGLHIFHKNNELAGYAAVLHALQLAGITGHYGRRRRVAVLHYGLTGRGSIHALKGLGFNDITCFVLAKPEEIAGADPDLSYEEMTQDKGASTAEAIGPRGTRQPMERVLAEYDIIVNCVFQDVDRPFLFARESDLDQFRPGAIIIDVSADHGLGFDFAAPTSFEDPVRHVGEVVYYAVDHTPSLLWRSATFEISKAILPYVPVVMGGPAAWERNAVIDHAIEMREGRILNPKILHTQRRAEEYPHVRL